MFPLADLHLPETGQHLNAPLPFPSVNNQPPTPLPNLVKRTTGTTLLARQQLSRLVFLLVPARLVSPVTLLVLELRGCSHLWLVALLHRQSMMIVTDRQGLFHLPDRSAISSCLQGLLREQKGRHLLVPATIATSRTLVEGLDRISLVFFCFSLSTRT